MNDDVCSRPIQDIARASERETRLIRIEAALRGHVSAPLQIRWSMWYEPAWNAAPERYMAADIVAWGRSRRLARFEVPAYGFKSYLGVQAWDPGQRNLPGVPEVRVFLSTFAHKRTLAMRTVADVDLALDALADALDAVERAHHSSITAT